MRGAGARAGFSLVEPLVATVLLGLALAGTTGTLLLGLRIRSAAALRGEALALAAEVAERVRLEGDGAGEAVRGGVTVRWEVPAGGWGTVEVAWPHPGGGEERRTLMLRGRGPTESGGEP